MGACQSCLGSRKPEVVEESEENRLLYDDANGIQYGSFNDGVMPGDETIETQRENEALQRVVAKTSSNMVDVFDIAPRNPGAEAAATAFGYTSQDARAARYQHLVSKLHTEQGEQPAGIKVDWLDGDQSLKNNDRPMSLKTLDDDDDALVGTFADAAAAATR